MRGISCFVHILRDRNKLLRLKLTKLFPNINFSGEKDSGKVLIIIIILFLIIMGYLMVASERYTPKLKKQIANMLIQKIRHFELSFCYKGRRNVSHQATFGFF